jgi:hypothetical protein
MNVQEAEKATPEVLLQSLIDQQGVEPVTDLDELADLWPANDDPDKLMAFILTDRKERHFVTEQKEQTG